MDKNGLSDPYVILTYGESKFQTPVVEKTLQPVWTAQNEAQFTALADVNELHLEVMDKDLISDDFIGQATFSLKDVIQSPYRHFKIPIGLLDKKNQADKARGTILFEVWYASNTDKGRHMTDGALADNTNFQVRLLRKAIKHGSAEAMYLLALLHESGERGVDKNEMAAKQWFSSSAGKGHIDAMRRLAEIEYQSNFHERAVRLWLQLLEHEKDADALAEKILPHLSLTTSDQQKIFINFARERGDKERQSTPQVCKWRAIEMKLLTSDYSQQERFDQLVVECANLGNIDALEKKALRSSVVDAPEVAAEWYRKFAVALKEKGDTTSSERRMCQSGTLLRRMSDHARANETFAQAGQLGQVHLAKAYLSGLGVSVDYERAKTICQNVTDADKFALCQAQYLLGIMHADGLGVAKDAKKAFDLFEKASSQCPKAYLRLAEILIEGREDCGIDKNIEKAVQQLSLASNSKTAKFWRALCILYGYGVQRDTIAAMRLFESINSGKYQAEAKSRAKNLAENGRGVYNELAGRLFKYYDDKKPAKNPAHDAAVLAAALAHNTEALLVALGEGGSPDACEPAEKGGQSALHYIAKNGDWESFDALRGYRFQNSTPKDSAGNTPLHWAASAGQFAMCHHLLHANTIPDARNNEGKTAAQVAKAARHIDVWLLLEVYGAKFKK